MAVTLHASFHKQTQCLKVSLEGDDNEIAHFTKSSKRPCQRTGQFFLPENFGTQQHNWTDLTDCSTLANLFIYSV